MEQPKPFNIVRIIIGTTEKSARPPIVRHRESETIVIENDPDAPQRDSYEEALAAKRLQTRISAVLGRTPKPVPVPREDGTMLLHGRRRTDRNHDAPDRRSQDRRRP